MNGENITNEDLFFKRHKLSDYEKYLRAKTNFSKASLELGKSNAYITELEDKIKKLLLNIDDLAKENILLKETNSKLVTENIFLKQKNNEFT